MALIAEPVSSAVSRTRPSGLVHGPLSPLVDTKRTSARIAASDATVLLTGETGTGKEVFARFIHASSPRAAHLFVPVNCGAIPETLLESELFGYVKGAFTGAVTARRGRVAMADAGTLFLDEIGELPLVLQVKLLRLLQEKTYEPIGSSESLAASFRLIAATNRDLAEEVRAGRFRADLYYRLHVCPIRLPPLRERRGDIAPLFQYFWSARGETRRVEAAVMQSLDEYDWPGNVRELENLVERLSVCSEGEIIRLADLPIGMPIAQSAVRLASDTRIQVLPVQEVAVPAATVAAAAAAPVMLVSSPPIFGDQRRDSELTYRDLVPQNDGQAGHDDRHHDRHDDRHHDRHHDRHQDGHDDRHDALRGEVPELVAIAQSGVISLPSLAAMAEQARLAFDELRREAEAAGDAGNTPTPILQLPIDLPTMLRELENAYINAALTHTGSNKKEAARLLGMGRTTLVEKLRRRASDARSKEQ